MSTATETATQAQATVVVGNSEELKPAKPAGYDPEVSNPPCTNNVLRKGAKASEPTRSTGHLEAFDLSILIPVC